MNEIQRILQNLIQEFSTENLIHLFRYKTRTFREISEERNYYNNDFFSNGLFLGEAKTDDEDEIVIYTFKTNKELTERSGKKAQYELAKKILKQEQRYSAGFFIFYDDDNNFRFSLVYDVPLSNGRREWSNFRRFTYYISKEQTNKTFLYRLDIADFTSLEKIKEAFSVEKVTKEFYTEIANWYFWALKNVNFPKDAEAEKNGKNIALIRFITRIIFIWFMKQKNLIKNVLFDKNEIKKILKTIADEGSSYYKAILQNLFFATLNTPIAERKFRREKEFQGKNKDYMNHNYYRYHSLFNNPDDMLTIFKDIPFLNGGLFECLDIRKNEPSNEKSEDLSAGASAKAEIRIDGFSDKETNQTIFPNFLFFSDEREVDLNKDYGTASKRYKVRGLVNILQSYNFTIDENTPTDEEIALDPELLGRVFENLLASYNPETASTARKSTGSYYTPREIVNYMVDESLLAYLKNKVIEGAKSYIQLGTTQTDMFGNKARVGQLKLEEELLPSRWINKEDELEKELRKLVSYSDDEITFTDKETDILIKAINNCKILDPAVGSGAFPMGVLHKLVLILSKIDPHNIKWKQQQISAIESNVTDPKLKRILIEKIEENFNRNELDYGRKLYLIQNCLYGVDIQPIAIQIAKLRFFISLLVDEKVQNTIGGSDNYGIEPLPNLETKLVAANTLIGLPQSLTLRPRELEKLENDLFDLRRKYFMTNSENEKKTLEKNDRELRQGIKYFLDENSFPAELAEKISKWDPYNTNVASDWFDPEWMFGVTDGFDIVIGNPPYIKEYTFRNAFNGLRTSTYYKGKMDIWYLFACKGIDLLKKDTGILTYIAQNNWVTSYGASKMRNKVIQDTQIIQMLDFGSYMIFESSDIQTMVMIFRVDSRTDNYKFDYRRLEGNDLKFNDVLDLLNHNQNSKAIYLNPIIQRNIFKNKSLTFSSRQIDKILNKISEKSNFKLNENEIANGIHHHHDRVDKDRKKKLGNNFNLGDGIFVLSNKEKEKIPFNKEELRLIKPSYTTKELGRYYGKKENKEWVIYTDSKYKNPENIKPYPNIKNHLDKFQVVITSDNKPYGLHRARDEKFFKGEKIIAVRKCLEPTFTYTDFDCYVSATFYIIKTKRINLKYLTALLNSKLIAFWLKHKGKMQGDNYQIDKEPLLALPIIIMPNEEQQSFIDLVDKILAAKKDNPQADTSVWEKEIDELVYQLYELTEEEIGIIEKNISR